MPVLETWAASDTNGNLRTYLSMTAPSGIAAEDLQLLIVESSDTGDADEFTINSGTYPGWTKIDEIGDSNSLCHIAAFWKEYVSGSTAVTVDAASSDPILGWYLRISGADLTTPIHQNSFNLSSNYGTSKAIPGVTTTIDGCLCFYGIVVRGEDAAPLADGSGNFTLLDENSSGSGNPYPTGAFGEYDQTTAGSTGTHNITLQDSLTASYFQLAVAPLITGPDIDNISGVSGDTIVSVSGVTVEDIVSMSGVTL